MQRIGTAAAERQSAAPAARRPQTEEDEDAPAKTKRTSSRRCAVMRRQADDSDDAKVSRRRGSEPGERAGGDRRSRRPPTARSTPTASRGCRGSRWSPTPAADADRRLALSGGRGPGRPGHPLAEPADPLRPRHAKRRGAHRRDPDRGRQARWPPAWSRATRSAAKEIVASARNGFPWQASIGAASRSSSSSRRTRRCWSTAGSSSGR